MFLAESKNVPLIFGRTRSSLVPNRIAFANIKCLFPCKNRRRIFLAVQCTSSDDHVPMIISICSWPSVTRIYAGRIVTTMKNLFSFGYRAIHQFPCDTMSMKSTIVFTGPNQSIEMLFLSICNSRTNPHPTSTKGLVGRMHRPVLVDFFPKSIFKWYFYETSVACELSHAAIL